MSTVLTYEPRITRSFGVPADLAGKPFPQESLRDERTNEQLGNAPHPAFVHRMG